MGWSDCEQFKFSLVALWGFVAELCFSKSSKVFSPKRKNMPKVNRAVQIKCRSFLVLFLSKSVIYLAPADTPPDLTVHRCPLSFSRPLKTKIPEWIAWTSFMINTAPVFRPVFREEVLLFDSFFLLHSSAVLNVEYSAFFEQQNL